MSLKPDSPLRKAVDAGRGSEACIAFARSVFWPVLCVWALVATALLAGRSAPGAAKTSAALALVTAASITATGLHWLREWRIGARRRLRRAEVLERRRERGKADRTRRAEDRRQADLLAELRAGARRERAAVDAAARREAAALAAARAGGAEEEAGRLLELTHRELVDTVYGLFEKRGVYVEIAGSEAWFDLVLDVTGSEARTAVRVTSPARAAAEDDVSAVEAWRRDAGASDALLISVRGFSPAAIDARGSTTMLVDGHLLAHWISVGGGPGGDCEKQT